MIKKAVCEKKLKNFTKKIGTGLKQEYHETQQIPLHIKNKNFKEAINQIGDLSKMGLIAFNWVLSAGAVLSGFIIKYSKKIRPSAFREEEN